jgi:hypothetical protein
MSQSYFGCDFEDSSAAVVSKNASEGTETRGIVDINAVNHNQSNSPSIGARKNKRPTVSKGFSKTKQRCAHNLMK